MPAMTLMAPSSESCSPSGTDDAHRLSRRIRLARLNRPTSPIAIRLADIAPCDPCSCEFTHSFSVTERAFGKLLSAFFDVPCKHIGLKT